MKEHGLTVEDLLLPKIPDGGGGGGGGEKGRAKRAYSYVLVEDGL